MTFPIDFTVPVRPVPKERPRFARMGKFIRTYTPKRTHDYEGLIADAARFALGSARPTDRPVAVRLTFAFAYAKSWSKKKREAAARGELFPYAAGDTDNLAKLALDAVNGVIWTDDRKVVRIEAQKVYGPQDFVRFHVEEIDGNSEGA